MAINLWQGSRFPETRQGGFERRRRNLNTPLPNERHGWLIMKAKVIDFAAVRDVLLVICDLIEQDISSGDYIKIDGYDTVWNVVAIKQPSPDLYAKGRRCITLKIISGKRNLEIGDILTNKHSDIRF